MKKRKVIILIAAVIAVIAVGILIFPNRSNQNDQTSPADTNTPQAGADQVFNLTFTDYNGNKIALADFRGKPIIVNTWATWCPFCVKELKDFAALQEESGEDVTVIAVDRSESLGQAKQYTDDLGVSGKLTFLLDPGDSFYRTIGGFSMPETIFVNKNGEIIIHKRGPMELDEMREKVKQIL